MAAAADFFHIMTTTRTGLHLLAFSPFNVGLVTRLVAALVVVRLGGAVGTELVAARLTLDGNDRRLGLAEAERDAQPRHNWAEDRNASKASPQSCAPDYTPHASPNQQHRPGS